jgi:hypothetical protein
MFDIIDMKDLGGRDIYRALFLGTENFNLFFLQAT